ncbi:MAG: aminotransferase class I/II-fold pyridoxal phosphate-dependent enzyme [Firmicutes bacterium]|nr:aminotransferase class I/II-fold pyridoxal phosphate-dependent enzyme [Bacillota bacterium]MDY4559323.1 aminotransferase class I/II-fold pyridoxal phosphate-dependent enzyme [Eubacteriales bacterium]
MIDYSKILTKRVQDIKPSGIRKFFDVVSEIKGAISLGVGEPDFITPWSMRNEAIKSIQKGYTQYTSNAGILKLRELISEYLKRSQNLTYNPTDEIIVTVGASEAIDLSLRALLDSGDEVLIPEPSYVSYVPCVELAGAVPVPIKCTADNGFIVTKEELEKVITPKSKVLILPYPNNPTGGIMTKEQLEAIRETIIKHNLVVLSDEIYGDLTYGSTHCSIASLDGMRERTILVSGFSKAFAMTGWRLGYLAAPKEIVYAAYKIHQYTIMCAPTASQYAAIAALEEGLEDGFQTVAAMRDEYDKRRRYILARLNEMGLKCFEPKGAFYVFPCVKSTGLDGDEFSLKLLEKEKVAVVPGSAFGSCGKDYVRISYAYSIKALDEALNRIEKFLKEI